MAAIKLIISNSYGIYQKKLQMQQLLRGQCGSIKSLTNSGQTNIREILATKLPQISVNKYHVKKAPFSFSCK